MSEPMSLQNKIANIVYATFGGWTVKGDLLTTAILAAVEQDRASAIEWMQEAQKWKLECAKAEAREAALVDTLRAVLPMATVYVHDEGTKNDLETIERAEAAIAGSPVPSREAKLQDDLNNWRSQCLAETRRADKAEKERDIHHANATQQATLKAEALIKLGEAEALLNDLPDVRLGKFLAADKEDT